ncbi:uncharacterized protein LOC129220826 [Uloborus diversus]|uniref:uncharacterized protein LOC129220826 n=1 Tax=Uloborus diversus TaxID=327109 RepID=UPI002409E335|nr:uncharacterized protein LOC129220826 [Uloborus diversus]
MQSSHTDFGQAGYPQYPFPPGALSGVPQANELSKQVQAAQQQGMYATSTSQGQQSMGPSASPQQPNPMNAQQQQHLGRTAHVTTMPNYYTRSNVVPRTLPGMGRAPLTTVVNQGGGAGSSGGQQPPSTPQYSHTVQMVPSHAFHHHPMQPIIVNTHHQLTAHKW